LRKEVKIGKIFAILIVVSLSLAANVCGASVDITVEKAFPVPGFSEGWTLDGNIKKFNPENLYKHINGEAELYLPYGFEMLGAGLYVSKDNPDKALAVDVYKMRSPLDAFGIYSRYRNPDAADAKTGNASFVNDSQLMFYQDRYFVQLSASGSVNPEPKAFIECAKTISNNIPGGHCRPEELNFISIPGVIPRTETYISQSVLGYAFFKKGLTAQAILAGDMVKIFIIFGESEKDSGDILNRYTVYLKDAKVVLQSVKTSKGHTFIAQDPLYKGFAIRQAGRYLIGAANLKDPVKGAALLDAMQLLIMSHEK
jgi:hypothetical protein